MSIFRGLLVSLATVFTLALPACEGDDPGDGVFSKDPGTNDAVEEGVAPEATEVVAGGGRVKGGNVVMDVQIGHGASQRQSAGDSGAVEGNSVVK
jgi:hypothetical protein